MVDLLQVVCDVMYFFDCIEYCYICYNYIGEWYSYLSFVVYLSGMDFVMMWVLVGDVCFVGSFVVLMIVWFDGDIFLVVSWVFDLQGNEFEVNLEMDVV